MNDQPVRDAQFEVMIGLEALIILNEQRIRAMPLVDSANYDNILWMIQTALDRNHKVPVDKTGRWIGFVQCALIVRGVLDTDVSEMPPVHCSMRPTRPLVRISRKRSTALSS